MGLFAWHLFWSQWLIVTMQNFLRKDKLKLLQYHLPSDTLQIYSGEIKIYFGHSGGPTLKHSSASFHLQNLDIYFCQASSKKRYRTATMRIFYSQPKHCWQALKLARIRFFQIWIIFSLLFIKSCTNGRKNSCFSSKHYSILLNV
jgi:hypothetical protein